MIALPHQGWVLNPNSVLLAAMLVVHTDVSRSPGHILLEPAAALSRSEMFDTTATDGARTLWLEENRLTLLIVAVSRYVCETER